MATICNYGECREKLVLINGIWMCKIHDKDIMEKELAEMKEKVKV